jgi:hypothetical protein
MVRNCLELQVVFAPPLFPANVIKLLRNTEFKANTFQDGVKASNPR